MRPGDAAVTPVTWLLRRLGADELVLAAADGGLEVTSRSGGQVMLRSLIQLDGDILTFVSPDLPRDAVLAKAHFRRVGRSLADLIAGLNRLLATLVALPAGAVMLATLPPALNGHTAAWIALAAEFIATLAGVALPRPRQLVVRLLLRPALRWLLRARGRRLLAHARAQAGF